VVTELLHVSDGWLAKLRLIVFCSCCQEDSEKFSAEFIDLVKHFLIVFKREPAVERAIDLIAKFSTSFHTAASDSKADKVEDKDAVECSLETSYQEDMHPFLLQLFRFLLKVSGSIFWNQFFPTVVMSMYGRLATDLCC
jgi:hypothetical protein